ncbi:hypothetical protein LWC05_06540 [Acetobacter sicerae]|uniref:Uncharacterized protein n=1 Tax=Acetobacter sicerae TaxID=85325 RepID=A0ABS8VRQ0_9PROT|nr:hypothetical protein [Acetobacter sicerae]MCE0743552.1 hypothetical protein [Acetobacter sicerae]
MRVFFVSHVSFFKKDGPQIHEPNPKKFLVKLFQKASEDVAVLEKSGTQKLLFILPKFCDGLASPIAETKRRLLQFYALKSFEAVA